LQTNTALKSITLNRKLSLVEFRDGKTTSLDLSSKEYGNQEAIMIGALLQVPYFHAFRLQLTPVSSPPNHDSTIYFLQVSKHLTSLDMSSNRQITEKGWAEFAKGLAVSIRASFHPMAPEMSTHNRYIFSMRFDPG